MPAAKMHADEVETDAALVGRLLAAQFPSWADLPITPVPSAGTDNALYRLGDDLVARLPRIHWAAGQPEKEHRWLPKLAPQLPLAVPVPQALGAPGEGYPWHWTVGPWFPGENATLARLADPGRAAADLARFLAALHRIAPAGGLGPGPHNSSRGAPLAARTAPVRDALDALRGTMDTDAAAAAWDAALRAPVLSSPPVWIHGDVQSGNLLGVGGRLTAVIDWGCLGVGDPACDLIVAWNLLPPEARDVFRAGLGPDDATWARGRGWALSVGLIALPYYRDTNPSLAAMARHTIEAVLAEG